MNTEQAIENIFTYAYNMVRPKNICIFAVTRASLLKSTDPKRFLQESAKNIENLFNDCYVSLGNFHVCLLKSQRFASFVFI